MLANALCAAMLQPVVQFLVVAKVKTLLLKLPLHVPVRLSDKQEPGMFFLDPRDYLTPIFGFWPVARSNSPSAFEDRVHEQHRHVAANAIALFGNAGDC